MKPLFARIKKLFTEDPILTRVLKNTSYLFSATSLSLLLSMIQSIFAARILGVAAFGLVGIVTSFVSTVNRIFSFRMGEFIVRYLGKDLTEDNQVKAGAVVKVALITEGLTSLVAFLILLLLAPLGAKYIAKDVQALPLIQLFAFSILAQMFYETSLGILQITNHFRSQAALNLIQSLLTTLLILIAFFVKGNILFVLGAYLAGKALLGIGTTVLAFYHLPRHLNPGWRKVPLSVLPPFKELAQFSLSTNLSGTVKMAASESEPLWVGFFLDQQAVGLYKLALAIVNPLMMPITPFITTTFPEMTRSIVSRMWEQLRRLIKRVTLISASWTLLVLLVMILFGRQLIELFYGVDFVPAYPAMIILLLGFGFANIFFWNRSLLLSFGKANIPLYVLAGTAILKIALSFWLIPQWGIIGAASLLSGYLILSTGILVMIGMRHIRQSEMTIFTMEEK